MAETALRVPPYAIPEFSGAGAGNAPMVADNAEWACLYKFKAVRRNP